MPLDTDHLAKTVQDANAMLAYPSPTTWICDAMTFLTSVHTLLPGSQPASAGSNPEEHDAWPQKPSSHTKCLHTPPSRRLKSAKGELNSCTKHMTKLTTRHISITQDCGSISRIHAQWLTRIGANSLGIHVPSGKFAAQPKKKSLETLVSRTTELPY